MTQGASIRRAMRSMTDVELGRLADAGRMVPLDSTLCLIGTAAGAGGYRRMHNAFGWHYGRGMVRMAGQRPLPGYFPKPEHRYVRLCDRINGTSFVDAPASVTRAINRVAREILAERALARVQAIGTPVEVGA